MSSRFPTAEFERTANARVVLLLEAIAARLGLNPTDLKCLDLVAGEDTVTPGRLAELSGLTSGAITGVLDRLEAAGLVRREPDPSDRRRFVVRLVPDRQAEIAELYADLVQGTGELLAQFEPGTQVAIGDFLRRRRDLLDRQIASLRGARIASAAHQDADEGDAVDLDGPLGGVTRGSLIFESGAARLTFHAAPLPGASTRIVAEAGNSRLSLSGHCDPANLYQASFSGPRPEVRASGGTVSVRYRFRGFLQRRTAEIALNPGIPWTVVLRGGLSDLRADLAALQLQGLDLNGGATSMDVRLPAPHGQVRLLLKGNATSAALSHPGGAALSLDISGNVEKLRFGSRRLGTVRGRTHLETADYGAAIDRYQAVFKGNAGQLSVAPRA
jgi:DNA-binding MarR family transcriptional regulator